MNVTIETIVEKYKNNPKDFIEEILRGKIDISQMPDETIIHIDEVSGLENAAVDDIDLSWQQELILKKIVEQKKLSVAFGENTLKGIFIEIALWWLICHTDKDLVVFAPHFSKETFKVWLFELVENSKYKKLLSSILEKKDFQVLDHRFINMDNDPCNSKNALVLCLVASKLPKNKAVKDFLNYSRHEKCVLFGIPTSSDGFFWETHHDLAKINGGDWSTLEISAEECPFVSKDEIESKIAKYKGRNTKVYITNIKAQFFTESNDDNPFTVFARKIDEFRSDTKIEQENLRIGLDALSQKLHAGNANNDALFLEDEEILMQEQYAHMIAYNKILLKRIELYKSKRVDES